MREATVEVTVKEKYEKNWTAEEIQKKLNGGQIFSHKHNLFMSKHDGKYYIYFSNGMYAEVLTDPDLFITKIEIFTIFGRLLNKMRYEEDKQVRLNHWQAITPAVLAVGMLRHKVLNGESMQSLNTMKATAIQLVGTVFKEDQRLSKASALRVFLS